MTLFNAEAQRLIAGIAREIGVEPAALMAVAEVESRGRIGEAADPSTPVFLFEQHKFWRNLPTDALRAKAQADGLARPSWNRAVQYQSQRTSEGRLDTLRRARAINDEAALASCSWGVGQVMGEHARRLGFGSARALFDKMQAGGVTVQVDLMARFIKADPKLITALKRKAWAKFAEGYNGPGYKENAYDTKMAAAYARWAAAAPQGIAALPEDEGRGTLDDVASGQVAEVAPVPPTPAGDPITDPHQVSLVQTWLRNLGYTEVGTPDGKIGPYTKSAIAAYRAAKGLPAGDFIDDDLILMLAKDREPREVAPERANADAAKVQAVAPEARPTWCNKVWSGLTALVAGAGAVGQGVLSQLDAAKGYIEPVQTMLADVPAWVWFAAAAGIAFYIWRSSSKAEAAITEAVQTGARR
jgi:peptidoglycan hydrolase-like protein with peptidoglycan-binding domain